LKNKLQFYTYSTKINIVFDIPLGTRLKPKVRPKKREADALLQVY